MKYFKLLFLLLVLIAAGIGASRFLHSKPEAQAAAAQQEMPPMPVAVLKVEEQSVQIWKEFPGRLEAVDAVDIRPQVSGTIKEIRFDDGQMVKAGDILLVIDPRPYEAEVAQSKADLQAARNQHDLARKELKRAEELISSGAIPKRTYDERLSNELVARNAVASAEAKLKRAQLNLDYAYVKAPISGRVSRAEITAGNLVDAGANAPVLTTIVSNEGIYADFEVDEQTYLRYVHSTAKDAAAERKIPVKLTLQNYPDMVYEGNIHSFDNKIDTASGTIRARAYFKNEDGSLLPGMFINVSIGSSEMQTALIVPERAIGTDQSRKFVYVVSPEKKVAYREVTLGDSVNGSRIVLSGLQNGDLVITDGLMKLRPDMPVEPQMQKEADLHPEAQPVTEEAPAAGIEELPPEEQPKDLLEDSGHKEE